MQVADPTKIPKIENVRLMTDGDPIFGWYLVLVDTFAKDNSICCSETDSVNDFFNWSVISTSSVICLIDSINHPAQLALKLSNKT